MRKLSITQQMALGQPFTHLREKVRSQFTVFTKVIFKQRPECSEGKSKARMKMNESGKE